MCKPLCASCPRIPLWAHLMASTVGSVLQIIGAVLFVGAFHNYHAGIWSLFAGLFAFICLYLHTLRKYGTMETRHTPQGLKMMYYVGIVGATVSAIACVVYLISSCSSSHPLSLHPLSSSLVLPAIQALLCVKWAAAVAVASKEYGKELLRSEEAQSVIAHSQERDEDSYQAVSTG